MVLLQQAYIIPPHIETPTAIILTVHMLQTMQSLLLAGMIITQKPISNQCLPETVHGFARTAGVKTGEIKDTFMFLIMTTTVSDWGQVKNQHTHSF